MSQSKAITELCWLKNGHTKKAARKSYNKQLSLSYIYT